jgi:hypothetical protein
MSDTKRGDVILRGSPRDGFTILDAATERRIVGPTHLSRAVQLARAYGAIGVWKELVDERGASQGPPRRLRLP